jgi:hypothetical protein
MSRARFEQHIGAENLCATYDTALERARVLHEERFTGAWPKVQ